MLHEDDVYLVDCDEVLVDCVNPFLDELKVLCGERYLKEDMKSWDILGSFGHGHHWPALKKRVAREGFCSSFSLLPGAKEGLGMLQELPGTVVIVTSPMKTRHWTYERTEFISDHFGIPPERVIHTSGKEYVAGKCLIDDKVDNLLKWKRRNPRSVAFLWEAPYNIHVQHEHLSPVSSWEAVVETIKKL